MGKEPEMKEKERKKELGRMKIWKRTYERTDKIRIVRRGKNREVKRIVMGVKARNEGKQVWMGN